LSKLNNLTWRLPGTEKKQSANLTEAVWVQGLRPACFVPFCCGCEYGVLYYPREPKVRTVSKLAPFHTDPVVLAVCVTPDAEM
jgi:hypothetical protein